ncbi:MAG: peptidoglycan-binding protein [Patescibacteria group bacterium]|nr:peptidoglycan-binding protein [Patescibacteria group bacterium]
MKNIARIAVAVGALSVFGVSGSVWADTTPAVTVGTVSGEVGSSVVLPVNFASGTTDVSSLQFDLALPTGVVYASVAGGAVATAAGKDAVASAISGGLRILVAGLNQTPISSGPLASITLNLVSGLSAGQYALTPSNVVFSDPNGNAVTPNGQPGNLTVTAAVTAPVASPPPVNPTISSFSASPTSAVSGQPVTLSWNVSNANHLTISPANYASTALIDTAVLYPTQTTIYTLTAVNGTSSVSAQVTVAVSPGGGGGGGGGGGSVPTPAPAPVNTPTSTATTTVNTFASTTLTLSTSSLLSTVSSTATGTVSADMANQAASSTATSDKAVSFSQLVSDLRTLSRHVFALANKGGGLNIGSRGNDVFALQVFLMLDGTPSGNKIMNIGPTGFYGPVTQAAVAEWQRSVNLPGTGYFGSMSRAVFSGNS